MAGNDTDSDRIKLRSRAERLWSEKGEGQEPVETQADMMELIQELQIHQIELELQNEELQRTRDEVESGLRRFTDLYDFAPIGYMTLGANGTVRQINLTGAKFLGQERKSIINRRFHVFLPHASLVDFNQFLDDSFMDDRLTAFETPLRDTADGTIFVRFEAHANEHRSECRVAIMDITDRKQAEQSVERNLATNMALARLYGPLVAPDATITTAAEIVLQEAKRLTDSLYGYVGTIGDNGDLMLHTHISMMQDCGMPDEHKQMVFRQNQEGLYPALWGHALNTRIPHFTNEPKAHQASMGIPKGHIPLTNLLSVPVLLGDTLVGQIALTNKPGGYSKQDLGDINRLANYFALAVQRMNNKQSLTESRDLMQNILTGIEAGIIQVDKDSLLVENVNDIALGMLEGPEEDYVGSSCEIISFLDTSGESVALCPGGDVEKHGRELRMQRHDSSWIPVQRTILEDSFEGQSKYLMILFDISLKKNLERQLALAQKLESIGQLSSGVAHEINTPAQYVGQNLKFLQEAFEGIRSLLTNCRGVCTKRGDVKLSTAEAEEFRKQWESLDMDYLLEELPPALDQSISGIKRITSIVQALKRFVHPGADVKGSADINQMLTTTSMITRNEWKYNAELELDLDDGLPEVPCITNAMNQVFLNLIVNAAQALKDKPGTKTEKGTIRLQTRMIDDWVEINVHDTGIGIPEAIISRIFDPFFTTKDVGEGTGQGLSLVHMIVTEKHGGSIDVESEEGVGTKFVIRLPINPA